MKELGKNPDVIRVGAEIATWVFRIALTIMVSIVTSYAAKIDDVTKAITILSAQLPELEKRVENMERYVFVPKTLTNTP